MNMIERVARAAHDAQWEEEFPVKGSISYAVAIQVARAAIEAMMEPTQAMEMAAFDTLEVDGKQHGFKTGTHARNSVYQAMIRAALEEK